MPTFSYPSAAPTTGFSQLTAGDAKRIAARVVRSQQAPDDVGGEDALRLGLNWLQRKRWFYLGTTADVTLVDAEGLSAGTEGYLGEYTLPTNVKSPYSGLVGFDLAVGERPEVPIDYLDRRLIDKYRPANLTRVQFYSLWTWKGAGKIKFHAAPGGAGLAEIKYFRRMLYPNGDASVLDILDGPMENALVGMIGYYLATWNGADRSLRRELKEDAWVFFRQATGDDKQVYEEQFQIMPPQVWAPRRRALEQSDDPADMMDWGW